MSSVIIKAAISVFICCLIYLFFDIGTGVPFYAAIATVICIQQEIKSTFRIGLNRTIGTLIGGFTGMLVLYIIRGANLEFNSVWACVLISGSIIVLMYLVEAIKKMKLPYIPDTPGGKGPFVMAPFKYFVDFIRKNTLTNITCIAFLSVTVTHGMEDSITSFAFARIIDTLLGVFIAFFINIIPFSFPMNSSSDDDEAQERNERRAGSEPE